MQLLRPTVKLKGAISLRLILRKSTTFSMIIMVCYNCATIYISEPDFKCISNVAIRLRLYFYRHLLLSVKYTNFILYEAALFCSQFCNLLFFSICIYNFHFYEIANYIELHKQFGVIFA